MSLNTSLQAGLKGILAQQRQAEIAGNNISNVNTPGYSRQSAGLTPSPTVNIDGLMLGQGVDVESVNREYDKFVSSQLIEHGSVLGEENAKTQPLRDLERILGTGDESLATEIDEFFGSWHELSENPAGSVEREQVLYKGDNLLDKFGQVQSGFVDVSRNIDETLNAEVETINTSLREVADLNGRIKEKETLGHDANTEFDKRDVLLKELSKTLGVESFDTGDNQVGLQLPGGQSLVQGKNANELEAEYENGSLSFSVRSNNVVKEVGKDSFGGKFRGLLDIRDDFIPDLDQGIKNLRDTIVEEVNSQHELGYGLDGQDGRAFFTDASGKLEVAVTDTDHVAAAGNPEGHPGDNENAMEIHALAESPVMDGNETFVENYGKISSSVGTEVRRNSTAGQAAEDTMDQLENRRESVSGVSLEEEMMNLTRFQRGFEASSRFVQTIDEMMMTILDLKR
ncbi:MAG: flagellar hook-associated protein FlgK [Desulfobacterales bacterium]